MTQIFSARMPIALRLPPEMIPAVTDVFGGEYEAGLDGEGLEIVDLGANVGSFSRWSHLRWPGSTVHAFEPHPETFALLVENTRGIEAIACQQKAVFPTAEATVRFSGRFAGDGESGLVEYVADTFSDLRQHRIFDVPALHPSALPRCDILKIDVEGAEATILENLNVDGISLILIEYQSRENRDRILRRVGGKFEVTFEDRHAWAGLLARSSYQQKLDGDCYGRLFLLNRQQTRLRPVQGWTPAEAGHQPALGLRQLARALPGAARRFLRQRLRRRR